MNRKCSYRFMFDTGANYCRIITVDKRRKKNRQTGNTGFKYTNHSHFLHIAKIAGCSFIVRVKNFK